MKKLILVSLLAFVCGCASKSQLRSVEVKLERCQSDLDEKNERLRLFNQVDSVGNPNWK